MKPTITEVTGCRSCPFWGNSMDGLECQHPYWEGKGYECKIIDYSRVPEECPLRLGSVTNIIRLYNDKV